MKSRILIRGNVRRPKFHTANNHTLCGFTDCACLVAMSQVQVATESPERSMEEGAGEGYGGLRAPTPPGSRQTPENSRGEEKAAER